MHTEQTTNFSVRVAYDDLGLGPDDVVWMPSPVGHSTGFNYGVRFALYHGLPLVLQDRWDGRGGRASSSRGSGARTRWRRPRSSRISPKRPPEPRPGRLPPLLRLRRRAGAARARRRRRSGRHRRPPAVRLDRGAGRHVEPAVVDRRSAAPDRRRRHEPRRGRDPGRRRQPATGRNTPGELYVRGPNTCVGFFDDPERTARHVRPDGWVRSGDLVHDRRGRLPHGRRPQEGDHHPRRHQHRPPGDRGSARRRSPRWSGPRWSACPTTGSASACAPAWSSRPGATLDLATIVERLRASGLATYKLPERLEVLDALPSTASGKIQKHEIVQALGAQP